MLFLCSPQCHLPLSKEEKPHIVGYYPYWNGGLGGGRVSFWHEKQNLFIPQNLRGEGGNYFVFVPYVLFFKNTEELIPK